MIPKESAPIKHTVLIEIIAQGRLTYDEVRIASFVMRWSWGFDEGLRRQDWTKEFTISEIAKEMKMDRGLCSRTINKMINDEKLLRDGNKYQFNEHYENWKVLQKVTPQTVTISHTPNRDKKSHPLLQIVTPTVTNSHTPDIQETSIAKAPVDENALRKDTLKKLYKDTLRVNTNSFKDKDIKNKNIVSLRKALSPDAGTDFPTDKIKTCPDPETSLHWNVAVQGSGFSGDSEATHLMSLFAKEMSFKNGIGFRVNNFESALWLVKNYSTNEIINAIRFAKKKYEREKSDPAKFLPNLKSVIKGLDNWLGEIESKKMEVEKQKRGGYIV